MKKEEIISIICTSYNHEPYIRDCLEGFLMQKTEYPFEVIIHDDASQDDTAKIIKSYKKRYPSIFKPIFQSENQYSKGINIINDFILPNINGQFVAICEGDDYWTDKYKLQKQVDAMNSHPECSMCVHRVKRVSQDKEDCSILYPRSDERTGFLETNKFINLALIDYQFHTSSYFFRTEQYIEYRLNPPDFATIAKVGDIPMMLYFGQLGKVYYIGETMSAYRQNPTSSWTKSFNDSSKDNKVKSTETMIEMVKSYNIYTDRRFDKLCDNAILFLNYKKAMRAGEYRTACKKKYKAFIRNENFRTKAKLFIKGRIV